MSPLDGWVPLRLPGVTCHLLIDDAGCTLIDTGLIGAPGALQRALARHGCSMRDLHAILLTHGHADHTGGLSKITALSAAPVFAHPADQPHIDGRFPYRRWSRITGFMESFARILMRYRPHSIDQPLHDGQLLPLWGGLRVVHLPGHTLGHCGFYSESKNVLFCGDLCVISRLRTALPPRIFNSCPEHFPASIARIHQLNPAMLIPNHYSAALSPSQMCERFNRILAPLGRT